MKPVHLISFRAMGCGITVQLETELNGQSLLNTLPAQVEAVEAALSRFRPQSELMLLNRQAGSWVAVSPVLFENISVAKQAARQTEGWFNPLVLPALIASGYDRSFTDIRSPRTLEPVPAGDWQAIELRSAAREVRIPTGSALDLGGIAKGWVAMKLANDLAPYGPCLVNLGGDMVARGAPHGLPGWQINVEDPHRSKTLVSLWLRDASLVTSGVDYRRWFSADGKMRHHIVNPYSGMPAETDVYTVTIQHANAPTAEAYAKAVLLRGGEQGLNWLQSQWNAAGMVVRLDGAVLVTPQFETLIQ